MTATIRLGTCSFADEALVKAWYPRGTSTGEKRLRYYAEQFDTVEIDSSFYQLPSPETTANWAARVPEGFVFHVKAFAPMTRHGVRHEALPENVRELVEPDDRGRVERMPREVRALLFDAFREAIEPLRAAGKLGGLLFQMAPYVVYRDRWLEYLEWVREQLPDDDLLVEFRHHSWFDEEHRADTLSFLEQHGLAYVSVDSPRTRASNVMPRIAVATHPVAYVRFHGRNWKTWNIRNAKTSAERFDYMYTEEDLAEWVEPLASLAERSDEVYALMNNNRADYAPRSATILRGLLDEQGIPATGGLEPPRTGQLELEL